MVASRNTALAVIAALCLASGVVAQERSPVQAKIRYSDLNLASAEGRAALKARIHRVAEASCADMAETLAEKMDAQRCRREMTADAELQIARLTAPAASRLALAGAH